MRLARPDSLSPPSSRSTPSATAAGPFAPLKPNPSSEERPFEALELIDAEDRKLLQSLPKEKQLAALKTIAKKYEDKEQDALVFQALKYYEGLPEAQEFVAKRSAEFHENVWKPYRPQDMAIEDGIGLSESKLAVQRRAEEIRETDPELSQRNVRYPRAVQALYLKPLRRVPEDGVPSCDLQLRSFSVRNLEFFADFALRAAYYANLPAFGPHPLPRITERWTVPKSPFIYKKTQENFERVTYRRLIQIKDGHPDNVKLWLAFLRKHQYHGVGLKANIWEWSALGKLRRLFFFFFFLFF